MKTRILILIAITMACSFAGIVEAGISTELIARLKIGALKGSGQIPWPAFIILLATGIVGLLGIRRRGKKS